MSNSLDKDRIRASGERLAELEKIGRSSLAAFSPGQEWPLGDSIREVLGHLEDLLDAPNDDSPTFILRATIGAMRACGIMVTEPAGDGPLDGISEAPRSDTTPAPPDEWDDYGPEDPAAESVPKGAGVIPSPSLCPNCEQPLPADGKCARYLDCQNAGPAAPILEATTERTRTEQPCLAKDWSPTAAQIKGYAKDLAITEERVVRLLIDFRARTDLPTAQTRWGGTFKIWAVDQLPAV